MTTWPSAIRKASATADAATPCFSPMRCSTRIRRDRALAERLVGGERQAFASRIGGELRRLQVGMDLHLVRGDRVLARASCSVRSRWAIGKFETPISRACPRRCASASASM